MPASVMLLVGLTVVMAVLGVYRWIVAHREDDCIHIDDDPSGELLRNQQETTQSLRKIDRAGIALTVVTAIYGVALMVFYLYSGLNSYHPPA